MTTNLRMSGEMFQELQSHLYPGDDKEAVAIALCGLHATTEVTSLLVHKLIPIPYDHCIIRTATKVQWRTQLLVDNLEYAALKNFAIVKFHSHPTGFSSFSELDDISDHELFSSIFSWIDGVSYHGSAVMLPDGILFGRSINSAIEFQPFEKITIVGDEIKYFLNQIDNTSSNGFDLRTCQAFGLGTTSLLKQLTVGVVGCSGTGSPVVEQVVRLGFKKVVLLDPDKIELKNLNRILNSKMEDALKERYKVDVLRDAIESFALGTEVTSIASNLFSKDAITAICGCDVVFGCMDSVDGRQLLNNIATFYLIPYFDLGVKLVADGLGGIDQIWGTVHYLQPGKSSLLTRGVYTQEDLSAANLYRQDPLRYKTLKEEGYIKNVNVESPAVISVNMQIASIALIEFLGRVHRFRYDDNADGAITRISLSDNYIQRLPDQEVDAYLLKFVGRGECKPLLNMPEFT